MKSSYCVRSSETPCAAFYRRRGTDQWRIIVRKEVKRYKNTEIPDEIKNLPFKAFDFNVPLTGAITFKISFEPGVLPEVWPEKRQRKSRAAKAAEAKIPANVTEALQHALEQAEQEEAPQGYSMALYYHVTGEQRKALVTAVSAFVDAPAVYQNAPTFAYAIGEYSVDKEGTLTGPANEALITALQVRGFIAK